MRGVKCPMMLRKVLVLPAPLRPTKPTICPLAHLQAQSAQNLRGSDIDMQIAKLKHGAHPRAVARR